MKNTSRTELCAIWETFVRDPSNQPAAKKAQQWRSELLVHLKDCGICAEIKLTRSRDAALLAKFIGLERTLTPAEKERLNQMRAAARREEDFAIAHAQDLVDELRLRLGNPMTLSPYITPLALFQCIRAIEMIVRRIILHQARTAGGENRERELTYLARDGTIHLPDRKITQETLIAELALAADLPQDSAAKLLTWIWQAAYLDPNLFHGFTCEQDGELVRMVQLSLERGSERRSRSRGQ